MRLLALVLLVTAATADCAAAAISAPDIAALQTRAQAGNAEAEFQLAEAYRGGRGVAADPQSAINWYRRAAAQGHVRASEELGFALFAHGDRREAMPYIEKAAARGEARAFYLLGTAHFNGDYATRDWPLAYAQTMRAAAAGLPAAQRNLELMDHYLLPSDKTRADQILATLPIVRGKMQPEMAVAASPPAAAQSATQAPAQAPRSKTIRPGSGPAGTAAARGDWKVQLGAYGTADRAQERWKALKAKVPALAEYDQHIVASGSVQRLQAAGLATKAAAQALCRKVVAAGADCLLVAP